MIAVDTNILVYAHRRETHHHQAAAACLTQLAEGAAPWAIAWPSVYEFYSVVTNPRIWKYVASSQAQAWRQIEAWAGSPMVRLLGETVDFLQRLQPLVCRPKVRGAVVHDARIAAICLAHGVETLWTADRDFHLFPELPTHNPFATR